MSDVLDERNKWIDQLTKERDELKADIHRYQLACSKAERERQELRDLVDKANSVGYGTAFTLQIERIQNERDQLAAKCAEMRSVAQENDIQGLLDVIEGELPASESDGLDEYSRAAWKLCDVVRIYQSKLASNQCGAGWLSPEQRDHLTNKVAHLQNSLDVALHQKKVLVEALGYGTPWPVGNVLRSLSGAASHLLFDHDCDYHVAAKVEELRALVSLKETGWKECSELLASERMTSDKLAAQKKVLVEAVKFAARTYSDEKSTHELAMNFYEVSCIAKQALEACGK